MNAHRSSGKQTSLREVWIIFSLRQSRGVRPYLHERVCPAVAPRRVTQYIIVAIVISAKATFRARNQSVTGSKSIAGREHQLYRATSGTHRPRLVWGRHLYLPCLDSAHIDVLPVTANRGISRRGNVRTSRCRPIDIAIDFFIAAVVVARSSTGRP